MKINSFLEIIIQNNNAIAFFSTHKDFRPIRMDQSLSSHPHNDLETIERELKERFLFVTPLFMFDNAISARPKREDVCIGLLYSNSIDVKQIIKGCN